MPVSSPRELVRLIFSPLSIALMVVGIGITVAVMIIGLDDVEGEWPLVAQLAMGAGPALVGLIATIEVLWRRGPTIGAWVLARASALVTLASVLCGITAVIVFALPAFRAALERRAGGGEHGFFQNNDSPHPATIAGMFGFVAGLLAMIAGFVVVVLPYLAIVRPEESAQAHMLDTDPRHARGNRIAAIAISLVVVDAFAIAGAMTTESYGLAALFIAVAVVLTVIIVRFQRVDRRKRREAGYAEGVEWRGPDD